MTARRAAWSYVVAGDTLVVPVRVVHTVGMARTGRASVQVLPVTRDAIEQARLLLQAELRRNATMGEVIAGALRVADNHWSELLDVLRKPPEGEDDGDPGT
jgi:hypothetical protein